MITEINNSYDFPKQKVTAAEREKVEFYANCCDWIIGKAISIKDEDTVAKRYNILNGNVPEEYYKKILNPYNAKKEQYRRFPATMRNYDMMKGIIRRYISEYIKNPHEFIVGANNPEVVLAKDAKLREEVSILVQNEIAARIQQSLNEYIQQGGDPQQFNPKEQLDIESFVKEFNENYIDEISAQGQEILNVIKDITEDTLFYAEMYFNYVTFGECYSYADVEQENLIKRVIPVCDAYPIPNGSMFVEDFDAFAEKRKLTYQQIIDEFDEYLTNKDKEFLETYYGKSTFSKTTMTMGNYKTYYADLCGKFSNEENNNFNDNDVIFNRDRNDGLFDVWHVVWRGEVRKAVVTYVNQVGIISTRIELEEYKLNKEAGDISIEYFYEPQVFECTRIGNRHNAIYPYKCRAIAYDRKGKLPYNGVCELLPGFGKFSIVDILTPFQVFYNIVAYHRELTIAKNKVAFAYIPKSLLGPNAEETIYKIAADGVLYGDDKDDQGMLRSQQIRMINASVGDYIKQLGELLMETEEIAKQKVDMTAQRYGEIANSAGKSVTEEAIARGSMGTVIVEFLMDCVRERDYARDMDYSKLAWIDGLNTSYRNQNNDLKYISLNVNNHIYADYVIKAKNTQREQDKFEQLKQLAFSAAQNGDMTMAMAAIEGDNVSAVSQLIKKFNAQKEQHEMELKQLDQQLEQMKQEFELQKIQAKGEEDRKTEEVKAIYEREIALIKADANAISFDNGLSDKIKSDSAERLAQYKNNVDREKLALERQNALLDFANKERDRKVKEKDIEAKIKIAKTNKNRYDKK